MARTVAKPIIGKAMGGPRKCLLRSSSLLMISSSTIIATNSIKGVSAVSRKTSSTVGSTSNNGAVAHSSNGYNGGYNDMNQLDELPFEGLRQQEQKNENLKKLEPKDVGDILREVQTSWHQALQPAVVQPAVVQPAVTTGQPATTAGQPATTAGQVTTGHYSGSERNKADVILIRHGVSEQNVKNLWQNITGGFYAYDPHLAEHAAGMKAISGLGAGAKPGGVLRGVLFQMLFYTHESLQSAGITVSAGKTIGQTSTAEQQMTAKRYFFSKVKFLVSTLRRTMETLALIMFVMVSQIQDMIEFLQQNPALQNLSLSLPSSVSSPSGRISKVNLLHLLKVLKSYLLQAQWEIRSNLEELGPAPTNKSPYFVKGMNPFTKEPLELRSTGLSGSVDESVRPFSIRQSRPSLAGVTPAQTSGMGVTADQTPRVQCFRECVSADFDAMVDDDDDDDSTDSDSDDEEDDSSASGADSVRPSAFEREFKGQVVDSSTRDSRRQTNSGSKWTQWWPPECADNEYPRTNNMSMWPKESKDAKKKDSKDGNKNDAKKKREEAQKQALLEKKNVEKRKLNKIGPKVTTKGEKVPFFETLFANTTWFKTMNASQSEVNAYRKGWTYGNMYFRRFFEGKRKTSFFRNDLAENFWKKDMRKMMMVDSRSAGSSVAAAVSSSAAASSSSAPNGSVVPLPRGSAAAVAPPPGLIFTSTHSLTIQQSMRRGYVTMSEVKPVSGVRPILKNSSSKNSRDSENERKSRWSSLKKGAARKLKRKRTPTSPKSDSSRCSDTRRPSTPPRGTGTSQAVQNKAVEKARKERKENKDKRKKVRKFSQDAQTGGYVTQEPIFNNDCSLVNNGNLLLATNNKFQYLEKKAAKDMKKKCQSYLDDHGKLRNFGVMALRQLSFDSNGAITEFPEVKSMDVLSFGVQKGKEELYTR